jgi:hypothetical protein
MHGYDSLHAGPSCPRLVAFMWAHNIMDKIVVVGGEPIVRRLQAACADATVHDSKA